MRPSCVCVRCRASERMDTVSQQLLTSGYRSRGPSPLDSSKKEPCRFSHEALQRPCCQMVNSRPNLPRPPKFTGSSSDVRAQTDGVHDRPLLGEKALERQPSHHKLHSVHNVRNEDTSSREVSLLRTECIPVPRAKSMPAYSVDLPSAI